METKNTPFPSFPRRRESHRHSTKFAGFTLTELIVVITILAILGAVAFVSLSGFSRWARDSVRVSTVSGILRGLNISYVKTGKHPLPDSPYVSLVSSGATVGYQGYAGEGVLRLSGMKGTLTDPVDWGYYVYSVGVSQDRVQFLALLEESGTKAFGWVLPIWSQANAAGSETDYSARYPFVYGDTLGILLASTGASKNQPIQEMLTGSVDLGSGSIVSGYTAYLSGANVSGTGISSTVPPLYNPSATCGSSNGGGFVSAPTTNLCAIGSSTGAVNSGGSWVWTCSASNGTKASCGGSVSVVSPAACGTATATPTSTAPNSALCASGNPSAVGTSGSNWTWNCLDGGGSVLASCSVAKIIHAMCGVANTIGSVTAPSGGSLCDAGTASSVVNSAGTWTWSCAGVNGGNSPSCSAPVIVNASCGTSAGNIAFFSPASNLCTSGTISGGVGTSGNNFTWSCNGSNGGSNVSCVAPNATVILGNYLVSAISGSFPYTTFASGAYDAFSADTIGGNSANETYNAGKYYETTGSSVSVSSATWTIGTNTSGCQFCDYTLWWGPVATLWDGTTSGINQGAYFNPMSANTNYLAADFGTAVTPSSFGIACYLGSETMNFNIQYSDNGSSWNNSSSTFNVTAHNTWYDSAINAGSHRYWRFLLTNVPYIGYSHAITEVRATIVSSPPNMTLISNALSTASITPSRVYIMTLWKDMSGGATLNTDFTIEASRDNGTTWTTGTITDTTLTTSGFKEIVAIVDVSSQPSGSNVKYRIKTLNNKSQQIKGVGVMYQ